MKLRYLFDPGSGVCLWAADDEAKRAFGYRVELEQLPLSQEVLELGEQLIILFDTSIDWRYPPRPSPWSSVEQESFRVASQQFYKRLVSELGKRFEIVDETDE
jgi:hypothetical protein